MTADASLPSSRKPLFTLAACAIMLVVAATVSYCAAIRQSPTFDEPLHAAAGYFIRWAGDYRIDVEDPALFTLISTLPHRGGDLQVDPGDPMQQRVLTDHVRQWDVVVKTMFRTRRADGSLVSGPDYIHRSRLVFTAILVMLGALLAWWAYQICGSAGALLACALVAFDPNFLAHGSLVKNDVAITLLMLWLAWATWLFGQCGTPLRLVSLALACALAANVKFSAPIFGVILFLALLVRALVSTPWPIFGRDIASRPRRTCAAIGVCLLVALISWAAIWCVYGFRYSATPDPALRFDPDSFLPAPLSVSARFALWLNAHHLFPEAWLCGLLYTHSTSALRSAFLMNEFSITGWRSYFPLAMLFKTPIATLMGIVVIACVAIRRLRAGAKPQAEKQGVFADRWARFCIWLPIVVYGAAAVSSNLNLGLRHILPIYPFIYLLIAGATARWIAENARPAAIFAAAIAIGAVVESLAAWPHFIPFFNVACGRSSGGLDLLGDSNLDWGQDLPLLARWQQQNRDRRLYLAYFGSADPAFYGIEYLQVRSGYIFSDRSPVALDQPGVFAISASYLQGIYWTDAALQKLDYLRARKPIAVLGGSIYLYDWDPLEFGAWQAMNRRP